MAANPQPTTPVEKIDYSRDSVAAIRRKTSFGNWLSLLLGVLVLAWLSWVFYQLYQEVKIFTPNDAVNMAEEQYKKRLPDFREDMEQQVLDNAPQLAEDLSQQLYDSLPDIREQIQDTILVQTQSMVRQGVGKLKEDMDQLIKDHRDRIKAGIADIETDAGSKKFVDDLVGIIQSEMQTDMQQTAQDVVGTLTGLNERLAKLEQGKGLTRQEALMREILMLSRTLQNRTAAAKPAEEPPVARGAAAGARPAAPGKPAAPGEPVGNGEPAGDGEVAGDGQGDGA